MIILHTHNNGTHRACFVSRKSRSLTATQEPRGLGCSKAHNGQHQVRETSDWKRPGFLLRVSCVTLSAAPSVESVWDAQGRALSPTCLSARETSHTYFLYKTQSLKKMYAELLRITLSLYFRTKVSYLSCIHFQRVMWGLLKTQPRPARRAGSIQDGVP